MASSSPAATPRIAAFFDLDKTIIATSSAAAFSRPFYRGGLISRSAALRSAYAHIMFMTRGASEAQTERLRENLSALVTGWPVEQVTTIVSDTLHQNIDPMVYAEALELIRHHHEAGHDVVIVSASGSDLVAPIAAMLGADRFIATHMQIRDGKYTGLIDFYAFGENKATAIAELAAETGYDLSTSYAYSDSVTDEPMLSLVGHAFAVNPDRALRRMAQERGWGLLTFKHPITLRSHMTPRRVAWGVGVVVGGVALALWGWRRRVARRRSA
ncbi:HAD family hydrolase [Jonesia quinghaiensis]|uniref:HAD family hydrolase n=1 Tax=Jonesia quinghaiensis TaxID=262806 RepID=UPI0003F9CC05|nr:HAD-IB family hydrolase [Jonesia quinghaiensis]